MKFHTKSDQKISPYHELIIDGFIFHCECLLELQRSLDSWFSVSIFSHRCPRIYTISSSLFLIYKFILSSSYIFTSIYIIIIISLNLIGRECILNIQITHTQNSHNSLSGFHCRQVSVYVFDSEHVSDDVLSRFWSSWKGKNVWKTQKGICKNTSIPGVTAKTGRSALEWKHLYIHFISLCVFIYFT